MSAGTVFTELDLDFSKFEKNQQKLLQSAQAASTSVEANWKNLGAKSDNIYAAMRASAENSFEMIKNHAGSSTAEIARAYEAMNAKIKAANDEQFGTSAFDTLKKNWLALSAGVVAAFYAVSKAMDFSVAGAKLIQTQENFSAVTSHMKIDADGLLASLTNLSKGTIAQSDLMQSAQRGLLQGLSTKDIESMMTSAKTLSQVMGVDVKEAYDTVSHAVETLSLRGFKQLGIVIDQQKAYDDFAKSIGTSTKYLTDHAKELALVAALQQKTAEMQNILGDSSGKVAEKMQVVIATIKNNWDELGKFFGGVAGKTVDLLGKIDQAILKFRELIGIPQFLEFMRDKSTGGGATGSWGRPGGATGSWGAPETPPPKDKGLIDTTKMADDYRKMMEEANLEIAKAQSLGAEDFDAKEKEILATYAKNLEKWKDIAGGFSAAEQVKNAQLGKVFNEEKEWVHKLDQELATHAAESDKALKEGKGTGWEDNVMRKGEMIIYGPDGPIYTTVPEQIALIEDLIKKEQAIMQASSTYQQRGGYETQGMYGVVDLPKGHAQIGNGSILNIEEWGKANILIDQYKAKLLDLVGGYNNLKQASMDEEAKTLEKYRKEIEGNAQLEVAIKKYYEMQRQMIDPMNKFMVDFGNEFSNQMASMVSSAIQGTQSIGEAFKKMGQNMLNYFIEALSKMAMNMTLFGSMTSATSIAGMFGGGGLFGLFGKLFSIGGGGSNYNVYSNTNPIDYGYNDPLPKSSGGGSFSPKGMGGGKQSIVYNDNRTTNYNDFVDAQGVERIMPSVIKGMGRTKNREAMKNIVRRSM